MLVCSICERNEEEVKITKKTMICRSCYKKEYQKNNKEKIKEKRKEYNKDNKESINKYKKEYYENNKDHVNNKESKKEYYVNNKEYINAEHKKYRENNKEFFKEYKKEYYESNKEKCKINQKMYRENNKDKINMRQRERLKNDNLYRLSQYIRNSIYKAFSSIKSKKNSKTSEILGCSFIEFRLHLESKFEDWMTWDNYGKFNGEFNFGWDIDHITPISSAKTEEDVIRLNHFTNLQPLCSKVNRYIKKDNLTY